MVLTSALVFFYFRDYVNAFLDWNDYKHQRRMAKSEVQRCLQWLLLQQEELENASFGRGKVGVLEALAIQHSKVKDILKFKRDVDGVSNTENQDENSLDELSGIYGSVKAVSDKRNSCLELINHIASLEDHVQNLSVEFDARAVFLASTSDFTKNKPGPVQSHESLATTTKACISSVRQNWKWIFQLVQCTEVHLRNAAAYQEFFQEVEEAEHWMNTTLSQINLSFEKTENLRDKSDVESFLQEVSDVLTAYLQWQTKVEYLFDKARQVVPVPLRVKSVPNPRPVIALTDFKSSEIEFIEGETLTLLDNSDKKKWKVKTETGQTGTVPSVIILITSPETEAVDAAIRLRFQLLALWTSSVKSLGYHIISFLLFVFRDWTEEEIKRLQALACSDKQDIKRIIILIKNTFSKNWSDYGEFQRLQGKITRLYNILETAIDTGENIPEDKSFSESLLLQLKIVDSLLRKYQDFWTFWEAFKCVVEMLKQPKFILVCDKWDQLKFVTSAQFVKFWDTQLDMDRLSDKTTWLDTTDRCSDTDKVEATSTQPEITKTDTSETVSASETPREELDVTIQEEKEESTTDTVTSTLEEEQHTFIIKGVLDPRDDNTQLTLEQAIKFGIVDESQKHYTNPVTRKVMTMTDAMNEGRVILEFVSKKKIREESNSYGVITITITKETKPYTIIAVIDPATDEKLSVSQAVTNKILDTTSTTYRTEKGELIPVADAIHSGLVLVDYQEGESDQSPAEVVTKTYIVHGVVDQRKKQKVSFSDAVRDGLLDRDTGEYVNNATKERVGVHKAILKGFIKARIATDPSKLETNPQNTIVIEKLSNTKSKLLKSVQAVKAFKA